MPRKVLERIASAQLPDDLEEAAGITEDDVAGAMARLRGEMPGWMQHLVHRRAMGIMALARRQGAEKAGKVERWHPLKNWEA